MQAIVLAAGMGTRLGSMTRSTPKALIEADGRPLIEYTLRFVRAAGATRVVVVGGFHYEELRERVAVLDPEAICVENSAFREGNIVTFRAALPHVDQAAGYLHTNTDHIYRPSIAELVADVAKTATRVTAFCDFDRTLGADDMKVALDEDRRVSAMSKQLESWDAGYVGMSYVPSHAASLHVEAVPAVIDELGPHVHVESLLVHLAERGHRPNVADISGHGWLEVDEPHERERAEATLRRERWWSRGGRSADESV